MEHFLDLEERVGFFHECPFGIYSRTTHLIFQQDYEEFALEKYKKK